MSRVRDSVLQAAAHFRVLQACLAARRSPPAILMYHGVTAQKESNGLRNWEGKHLLDIHFARHLRILKRSRRVIALQQMIDGLYSGDDLTNTVAVTFDDGYRNNIDVAAPILSDFGMTASFFMATDFIGSRNCMWTDRLEALLDRASANAVMMPGTSQILALSSLEDKRKSLRSLKQYFKTVPAAALDGLLDELQMALGGVDQEADADAVFMTWNQVRTLAADGFEIGAHTMSHPILTQLSLAQASAEIVGSRDRVQRETGNCSTTFCFPNGKLADFSPELQAVCRQHFKAALATERGPAQPDELFQLRRLSPAGPNGGENLEWTLFKGV